MRAQEKTTSVSVWLIWAAGLALLAWLSYLGWFGTDREHGETQVSDLGKWSIRLLIASYAMSPLARRLKQPGLALYAREFGLLGFIFMVAHVPLFVFHEDVWPDHMLSLVTRTYLAIGIVAMLALIPIGATSNGMSLRKLGRAAWRRVHALVYPMLLLSLLHETLYVHDDFSEITAHWIIVAALSAERIWNGFERRAALSRAEVAAAE